MEDLLASQGPSENFRGSNVHFAGHKLRNTLFLGCSPVPHVGHLHTWEGDIRKPSKIDRDQLDLRGMHRGNSSTTQHFQEIQQEASRSDKRVRSRPSSIKLSPSFCKRGLSWTARNCSIIVQRRRICQHANEGGVCVTAHMNTIPRGIGSG